MIYWTYMKLPYEHGNPMDSLKVLMCEDVGEITKVTPCDDCDEHAGLNSVIADGKHFWCNGNYTIVKHHCHVIFQRSSANLVKSRKKLDHIPRHGEKFEITADEEIDWDEYDCRSMLTNDPRMLYLTDMAYKMYFDMYSKYRTKQFREKFASIRIPEREEAIEYLKKHDMYYDPTAW